MSVISARYALADGVAAKLAAALGKDRLVGMSFVELDDFVRASEIGRSRNQQADITEALCTIQTVVRRTGANV